MDLSADITRIASDAWLAALLVAGPFAVAVLTALFGPPRLSERAKEVLRIIRRRDGDT